MTWRPAALRRAEGRRLFAPEVVQTSSMDCGPAALKCLLEGHGVRVSYGRLREACQTNVDGTSIDAIEAVARQLGIRAEQVLVPSDFICLDDAPRFPAVVVVNHADTATHFVVVWARHGNWLQIMDPAVGRRWVSQREFEESVFTHRQSVLAPDWRDWCDSEDFRGPMAARMAALGLDETAAAALLAEATADPGWFGCGALDAAVRLCRALVAADGLARGTEAARVLRALFRDTTASGHHIFAIIPPEYWSALPDITNTDPTCEMLVIRGGVMLKTAGHDAAAADAAQAVLPPELAAALTEPTVRPMARVWAMLRADPAFRPALPVLAVLGQGLAVLGQALVFRGLIEVAQQLQLPLQRVAALVAILLLALMTGLLDLGLAAMAIGQGRRLEARLRGAILAKLPRLRDRYFQSRPITDMADRSHAIHLVRGLPALVVQAAQAVSDLAFTLLALAWIAPASLGWALALSIVAGAVPLLVQPLLNERDLAVRNHGGALHGFFLDALLGLAPIRAHRAQRAIARQHESLLVEWAGAARGLARWSVVSEGVQALLTLGLAAALLTSHFADRGGIRGTDLLLVFWVLRLPGAAQRLAGLARSYPAMRNALLRQLEPLDAPDEDAAAARQAAAPAATGPARIAITGGQVVAGGHAILRDVTLTIAPGEHVAIVGRSGAGKSSLLGLLLGWHQLASGELLVDGLPLGAERLAALRLETAWVDPQVQVWNRTLLDNLTYAVDGQDLSRVRELVEASGLMGVSTRLPQGLQSPLGEGGALLSGGEGQRVRLGRALLSRSSRLALLDEPFRGLDREQRRHLLASARSWWGQTTLLCVSHDIAETLDFPRVLVIEDGRIAEDGCPADLARGQTRYRALLESELRIRHDRWSGHDWRRWQVSGGTVTEQGSAS
ncbi:cysteine peptidase family C39 domain-containing protein [Novosphingobium piscinae]|uniref:ATP-binding cassette domain-containing protein n=1 Tax=Novosphingobium piscinae TaxID=1507448 RepID=A0A7X1FZ54_9SPHN|nr:cysteine peptidase family C39 domain-containing protein [Novosphingobium piscinae]MBC2669665.1 ATP-binding cassette domain-containing protein [Novosphingobium piscinae]